MSQKRLETKIEKQSDSEVVREICSGDSDEEEIKRRVSVLIRRHPERFRFGLRRVKYGDSQWERARKNLGYEDPRSLAFRAAEYLTEVPQKGEYEGKRRICTFLEDEVPFGEWMSSKLFGLARQIRGEIQEEQEKLLATTKLNESGRDHTYKHTHKKDGIGETHTDLASLANKILAQLDSGCRGVLEAFFFSDESGPAGEVQENVSEVESCLRQCIEIMSREDIDPGKSGVLRGKAELWDCTQKLSSRCQSLILRRFFLSREYWKIGRALSENSPEEYESWEKYKRAEYDWARRIKNKCKQKVEQQCSEEAADCM